MTKRSAHAAAREARLHETLDRADLARRNGHDCPARRRGRTLDAWGWSMTYPTRREAKHALRKLRQWGYGRHPNTRAADRRGVFLVARWRRRLRDQQDALRARLVDPPF